MFFVSGPIQLTGLAIISSQSAPPFELGRSMAASGPGADSPLYVSKRSIAANLSVDEDTRGGSVSPNHLQRRAYVSIRQRQYCIIRQ